MGNLGGGEILVILMLGLLVLGPARLAVVARHMGSMVRKVRRVAEGFQEEIRDLVEDPSIESLARERGRYLTVPDGAATDRPTEQDGAAPDRPTEQDGA